MFVRLSRRILLKIFFLAIGQRGKEYASNRLDTVSLKEFIVSECSKVKIEFKKRCSLFCPA